MHLRSYRFVIQLFAFEHFLHVVFSVLSYKELYNEKQVRLKLASALFNFQPLTWHSVIDFFHLESGADLTIGAIVSTGFAWGVIFVLTPVHTAYACQDVVIRQHEYQEKNKPPVGLGFHVRGCFLTECYCEKTNDFVVTLLTIVVVCCFIS